MNYYKHILSWRKAVTMRSCKLLIILVYITYTFQQVYADFFPQRY